MSNSHNLRFEKVQRNMYTFARNCLTFSSLNILSDSCVFSGPVLFSKFIFLCSSIVYFTFLPSANLLIFLLVRADLSHHSLQNHSFDEKNNHSEDILNVHHTAAPHKFELCAHLVPLFATLHLSNLCAWPGGENLLSGATVFSYQCGLVRSWLLRDSAEKCLSFLLCRGLKLLFQNVVPSFLHGVQL